MDTGPRQCGVDVVDLPVEVVQAEGRGPACVSPRRWRIVVWVLVALNGFTRIYVGAHDPLDIVGGAGLGMLIGGPLYAWLAPPDTVATPAPEPVSASTSDSRRDHS